MKLRVSQAAAHPIVEQADYYREVAESMLAQRWETAVDEAVRSLLQLPERGALCRFQHPALQGLRWIPVPGFPRHLVFYRFDEEESSVLVVQVMHSARNLPDLLGERGDS